MLMSYQKENRSINMLTLQIGAVFFIMDDSKSRIKFGCSVGRLCNRNRGLTSFFGEKAYGSVFQPRYFDENRREKKSKTIRAREMHQKEAREYRLYFPPPPKK